MTTKRKKKSILLLSIRRQLVASERLVKAVGKDGESLFVPMLVTEEKCYSAK